MRAQTNVELFSDALLGEIRKQFAYIDTDPLTEQKRIFFDNAGGSFRLKRANEQFTRLDLMPNHPTRDDDVATYLATVEQQGMDDIRTIFNAGKGSIATDLTASQAMFRMTGIIAEHISGTNLVTTALEHPSAYDAAHYYAEKTGKELRVAPTNATTGGVDVEEIISRIDKDTSVLSVIYASNISGAILDIETIVTEARKIKPDLYIIVDAVQHAPHGIIDVAKTPVDVMNIAPYKFFGVRGSGITYVSDRVAQLPHDRLLGKDSTDLQLGTSTPGHFAATSAVVDYVCWIGEKYIASADRRRLYTEGMKRIALHERALLENLLNGTRKYTGLRHIPGVTVYLDDPDLSKRDLIVAMRIDDLDYAEAVRQYADENIIVYDRVATNIYSKRMLESFAMDGAIRISPMHCNTVQEIERFLTVTEHIAARVQVKK